MARSVEEIKGRLYLWYSAVGQCCELLDLYSKDPIVAPGSYSSDEIKLIRNSSVEMAIIYFCQVVNNGNGHSKLVANNNRAFRQEHWQAWVNFSIVDADKRYFEETVGLIKHARDQMLGHADGRAFDVSHTGPLTMFKQYSQSWKDIDIEFWKASMKNLKSSFGDYIRSLNL